MDSVLAAGLVVRGAYLGLIFIKAFVESFNSDSLLQSYSH